MGVISIRVFNLHRQQEQHHCDSADGDGEYDSQHILSFGIHHFTHQAQIIDQNILNIMGFSIFRHAHPMRESEEYRRASAHK